MTIVLKALPRHQLIMLFFLIALCTVVELVLQLQEAGVIQTPRLRANLVDYAGFWPGLLYGWTPNYTAQPYVMFVSYAFIHAGLSHLISNMAVLYVLGRLVLQRVGGLGFGALYTASAMGGAGLFALLAREVSPMVGASGAVFGLAGGLLAWNYVDRFWAKRRLWPVLWIALGLVVLNIVHWWSTGGHLAWEAHLGGFLSGWVAALLIDPRSDPGGGEAADPS